MGYTVDLDFVKTGVVLCALILLKGLPCVRNPLAFLFLFFIPSYFWCKLVARGAVSHRRPSTERLANHYAVVHS